MSAFSPYQAYPGPSPVLAGPPPVFVAVAEPAPQRRLTVAFRYLMAIPHLFVLYWVLLAAGIVAFIGWWGALFTARLPQFAVTFLSGVVRWSTRVHAYELLLTDVYPPFSMEDDPAYPVRVAIPEPQRLNRAAVFFRYFLAIPAGILGAVLGFGASTLMALVAWLIVLVAGQLPVSFYLAYAAVLRFQTRYTCFFWMLTPAYPGGLYGDRPGTTAWADALPAAQAPGFGPPATGYGVPGPGYGVPGQGYGVPGQAYGAPGSAYGTPADAPQGYGPTQGYGAPQGYGAAPQGYGTPAPGYGAPAAYGAPGGYGVRPLFQPDTWLLPLTSGARSLVTTFIVIGSLFVAGYGVLYGVLIGSAVSSANSTASAITADNQLNTAYTALSNRMTALQQASSSCDQNLTCVQKEDTQAAAAFTTFSGQLASISVPASLAADKARLSAAAATIAGDYTALSKVTTAAQYQAVFSSIGLQKALDGFNADVTALDTGLQDY